MTTKRKQPQPWRKVHQAADGNRERFRRLFLQAVRRGREGLQVNDLEQAFREFDRHGAVRAAVPGFLMFDRELERALPTLYFDTLVAGAEAAVTRTGGLVTMRVGFAGVFDKTNPEARQWAAEKSAELIRDISEQTREGIRSILTRTFDERSLTARDAAKLIRPLVGLTPRDSNAVYSRWSDLIAGGRSFDDAARAATKYADSLIRGRASTIARTESIRAANEGQRQLWDQAIARGDLNGREQREWIVTPDDRLCEFCQELDGQIVGIRDEFTLPDGSRVDGPPAHPNCRCAQGLTNPDEESAEEIVPIPEPELTEDEVLNQEVMALTQLFGEANEELFSVGDELIKMRTDFWMAREAQDWNKAQEIEKKILEIRKRHEELVKAQSQSTALVHEKLFRGEKVGLFERNIEDIDHLRERERTVTQGMEQRLTGELRKADEWLSRVFGEGHAANGELWSLRISADPNYRANYNNFTSLVTVSYTDKARTIIHELGHHIEASNDRIKQEVRSFFEKRTQGQAPKSLRDLTGLASYAPTEVAIKDGFIDAYMGKVYLDGSTEVLSMGLEMMYNEPLKLLKEDPEMFTLIYRIIKKKSW